MNAIPQEHEFAPYFGRYVHLIPEGDIAEILNAQLEETLGLLEPVNEEQASYRYEADKWSVKEVLGHVTDNERIWSYRLLRIARGDELTYPGYEQTKFIAAAQFDRIPFRDLLDEFAAVRKSTILMVKGFPADVWPRQGTLYEHPLTAAAAARVIAGHAKHHLNVLRERYLPHLHAD